MSMPLDIIVYGGQKIFVQYFNFVTAVIGDNTFSSLRNITVLLAGLTALVSAITKRDFLACVRWFAIYYFVVYVLFIPTVTVRIVDRTQGGGGLSSRIVDHVPLGLGVLAHVTSVAGDALTQLVDKVASAPDDMRYSETGMLMGSKIVLASRQFQITDSILAENMRQFVTQCVFWDILLNHYTLDDLLSSKNVWEFIKDKASPARACLYTTTAQSGKRETKVTVCKTAVGPLGVALKNNIEQVAMYNGSRIFPEARNSTEARNLLMTYLPLSYGSLLKTSEGATDLLQQSIMANSIMDGGLHFGIGANSQTAVASYAAAKAQEQQRLTQNTVAFQAAYWLPITKTALEAIMYGCFLFIVLLGVFPFGIQILKNYVLTLCWLQMWAPLYAIVNIVCSHYARLHSLGNSSAGYILRDISGLMQVNHDMTSLAGYLTMSVPFIALGLVKGMASTMAHVSQYLGGVTQSTASQAASEAVAGNISMGITGMRNNTAFNNSAFHSDLRAGSSGGMNYQLPSGENIKVMPDGSFAVDRGDILSNLGVDTNWSKSFHNSAMKQADYSFNTAKNEAMAASENYAAGTKNLYSLSEHVGKNKSSSDIWVDSESKTGTESLKKIQDLTQTFADNNDITYEHSKEILSRVNAGLGVEGSISASTPGKNGSGGIVGSGSVGANVGLDGSVQDIDRVHEQKFYNKAEQFIKNTGYSEAVETATRSLREHSFHATNDKGAKLIESTEGYFDTAHSYNKSAVINYQKGLGYREIASQTQESGINVNINDNDNFLNKITSEPGVNGKPKGLYTALADLRDPEMRAIMADNYARSRNEKMLSTWNTGNSLRLPNSGLEVNQVYQGSVHNFNKENNQDLLQERYLGNKNNVASLAKQKDINPGGEVDESVRQKVENDIATGKEQIQEVKEQMVADELAKEQKFKEEAIRAKQNREHGAGYTAAQTLVSYIPVLKALVDTPSDKIKDKLEDK